MRLSIVSSALVIAAAASVTLPPPNPAARHRRYHHRYHSYSTTAAPAADLYNKQGKTSYPLSNGKSTQSTSHVLASLPSFRPGPNT